MALTGKLKAAGVLALSGDASMNVPTRVLKTGRMTVSGESSEVVSPTTTLGGSLSLSGGSTFLPLPKLTLTGVIELTGESNDQIIVNPVPANAEFEGQTRYYLYQLPKNGRIDWEFRPKTSFVKLNRVAVEVQTPRVEGGTDTRNVVLT